uniref:Uncharacterized protein n=1 Tax=Avena sativa TaxID=4498 RepID=A0ACD5Z939_AVESA
MEATAVSIGRTALNGALGYAKSAVAEDMAQQLGVQRDKAFIADELDMMRSVILTQGRLLEEDGRGGEAVTTWVRQVRDVSYDVEDGLRDLVLRARGQPWWRVLLLDRRRVGVAEEMKGLRARVEDVGQRSLRYRLLVNGADEATGHSVATTAAGAAMFGAVEEAGKHVTNNQQISQYESYSPKSVSSSALPYTIENEIQEGQSNANADEMTMEDEEFLTRPKLIGREKEKIDLTELILEQSSTQQFQVIALWGMGGVGKTTLIRDIYQGREVNHMFGEQAFVMVSRPFKLENLLRILAFQLCGMKVSMDFRADSNRDIASMGVADLTDLLVIMRPQGKSCLVVLDGLSSSMEWDEILPTFLEMRNPSLVIVITTREEDIAKHCCKKPECIRFLNGLEEKGACDLFTEKVFKNKTTDLAIHYPELVEASKQILNKCNGLPLAIVTIGGFLADQPTKNAVDWRKLNERIGIEMEMDSKFEATKTVLMKSYDGLPYNLKSCLLYMSIFFEDCTVSRRRLVYRWTAEGYSQDTSIGDMHFMELVGRSMILLTQTSVCSIQGTGSCQLHDLIRDIVMLKAMEENLVFRLEEGCSSSTHGAVRHLVICSNWDGDESQLETTVDLSRIRSLTVFGKCRPFYISAKMRFLRVLDLEGTKGLAGHHLEHIGEHLHLRYLSLRGCDGVCYLPDSVGCLKQLETLDIKYTGILRLPKTITKLTKLCYLKAGNEFFVGEELLIQSCCAPLACCLMSRVRAYAVKVPVGIGKLKSLHTLGSVHLEWENTIIEEIKCLTSLRKLGVFGINRSNSLDFCSALSGLCSLESLSVHSAARDLYDCLQGVVSPPVNLRSLKLCGWLRKLPEWTMALPNLVNIKLEYTEVSGNARAMQVLGNLPNLSTLSLKEIAIRSEELPITFQGHLFRSLSVLHLVYTEVEVESVVFEETSVPKLELMSLQLTDCKTSFCGLELLPSIKEVILCVLVSPMSIVMKENMTEEEAEEEAEHREDQVKDDIRKQLISNKNSPVLKVRFMI